MGKEGTGICTPGYKASVFQKGHLGTSSEVPSDVHLITSMQKLVKRSKYGEKKDAH